MTRDDIRSVVEFVTGRRPDGDDCPVRMSSLQQLEFIFEIEDKVGHPIPEDVRWQTVNDVVRWLEKTGELQGN